MTKMLCVLFVLMVFAYMVGTAVHEVASGKTVTVKVQEEILESLQLGQ